MVHTFTRLGRILFEIAQEIDTTGRFFPSCVEEPWLWFKSVLSLIATSQNHR